MPNKDEFVTLVNEHQRILNKICGLYATPGTDRQDLYQEIMIQLWKSFESFRGESMFSTWLYRIAFNTAIGSLRREKKGAIQVRMGEVPDTEDDSDYLQKEEKFNELHQAIGKLNEIERAIVMLYLEDRSYDEMEQILGISANTLRVKMNRIKDKLRKLTKASEYGA